VTETEEDYTEDDFVSEEEQIEEEVDELEDKSSDLNEREDEVVDDLQSCPDDLGKSSMSNAEALIALDTDKITEELFEVFKSLRLRSILLLKRMKSNLREMTQTRTRATMKK